MLRGQLEMKDWLEKLQSGTDIPYYCELNPTLHITGTPNVAPRRKKKKCRSACTFSAPLTPEHNVSRVQLSCGY